MNDVKSIAAARRTVAFGLVSGLAFAIYALFLSREHITYVGYAMRLKPMEAETLFVFVDFIAMYGKALTSKRLSAKTRRIGYKFLIGGGVASLACNILAGVLESNFGEAGYGAALVGLIACLEYSIANTKAKATATKRVRKAHAAPTAPAAPVATTRKTCVAGCTCGKHNRRRAGEVVNPVSPGSVPVAELNASMAA